MARAQPAEYQGYVSAPRAVVMVEERLNLGSVRTIRVTSSAVPKLSAAQEAIAAFHRPAAVRPKEASVLDQPTSSAVSLDQAVQRQEARLAVRAQPIES